MSDQFNANSKESFGQLFPFLQGELTNPQGLSQQEKTDMQTEGGQATAGALGTQRALAEQRGAATGNTAAIPAVIAAGGRDAMHQQSDNAMGVTLKDAALKRQEQQHASDQIQGLYGTSSGDALNALGISNNALNVASNAKPSFWQQMAVTAGKNLVNAATDSAEAGMGM